MGRFKDLTGQKFGKLTVMFFAGVNKHGKALWSCKCECGKEKLVLGSVLTRGDCRSCGCLKSISFSKITVKHGLSKTNLYKKWKYMKRRCYSLNSCRYKNYGARGITVCDEWRDDFKNFYKWAINNGYQEGLSIERIDVNGNYCPENCKWILLKEQAKNKQNSVIVEINGIKRNLSEWIALSDIKKTTITNRIYVLGWSYEKAILTPVKKKGCKKCKIIS